HGQPIYVVSLVFSLVSFLRSRSALVEPAATGCVTSSPAVSAARWPWHLTDSTNLYSDSAPFGPRAAATAACTSAAATPSLWWWRSLFFGGRVETAVHMRAFCMSSLRTDLLDDRAQHPHLEFRSREVRSKKVAIRRMLE
ncbi:hypothetical protein U9M48_027493, partial [Paspalum notatum var. saurae]